MSAPQAVVVEVDVRVVLEPLKRDEGSRFSVTKSVMQLDALFEKLEMGPMGQQWRDANAARYQQMLDRAFGRRKAVRGHRDREFAAALHLLVHVLRTALGVPRELHPDEITEALVVAAVDERVTVSEDLPAVPHVDHDVASRREFREQTPGRMPPIIDLAQRANVSINTANAIKDEAARQKRYEEIARDAKDMEAFLKEKMEERRKSPQHDLVTYLLQAAEGGDKLTDREVLTPMKLCIIAGNDLTTQALALTLDCLLENPEQMRVVASDLSLAAHAFEEALRFNGPVVSLQRKALRDVEIAGAGRTWRQVSPPWPPA
jgi:cytochrome P450